MVRLRTLVILVIVSTAVTAGTALAAASWYWRGGKYVLPRYNQTAALQEILTEHKNNIDALTGADYQAQIDALNTLLAGVTRAPGVTTGVDTLLFSGMNVQVVNGVGTTDTVNGAGNVIVGYNELGNFIATDDKTGSHMVVVGELHNYSTYGGIVAGQSNVVSGSFASVSGGHLNRADGSYASVSGGYRNTASGDSASASGGWTNTASGVGASVSGGNSNLADGYYTSVSGGELNTASGQYASVSGGHFNTAGGESASVSGGAGRDSLDTYDWRAGTLFEDH